MSIAIVCVGRGVFALFEFVQSLADEERIGATGIVDQSCGAPQQFYLTH